METNDAQLPSNHLVGEELIAEHSELFDKALAAWHVGNDGYISCTLSFENGSMIIVPPIEDEYYRLIRVPKSRKEACCVEYQNSDLNDVMMEGERMIREFGDKKSAMKDAIWRNGSASQGQVKLLKNFGITNVQGLTKGRAAQLITHHICVERIENENNWSVLPPFPPKGA